VLRIISDQTRRAMHLAASARSTKEIRLTVRGIVYLRTSSRVVRARERKRKRDRQRDRANFPDSQFSAKRSSRRLLSRGARSRSNCARNLFINLSPSSDEKCPRSTLDYHACDLSPRSPLRSIAKYFYAEFF
jgi:hypothetical protein